MLPDYVAIKKKLRQLLINQLQNIENNLSIMVSQVNSVIIHEGEKFRIIREDGTLEDVEINTISTEIRYKITDLENKPPDQKMLLDAAKDLSIQKEKMFIKELDKIVTSTGNIVNCGGEKFTIEILFKLLEKISIDFDENGQPYLPQIFTNAETYRSIVSEIDKHEKDPKYIERFNDLLIRKKDEWIKRESNRKLVG